MQTITYLSEITDAVGPMVPILDNVPHEDLPILRAEFLSLAETFRALARHCEIGEASRSARLAGRIALALRLEAEAEAVFQTLPEWARW